MARDININNDAEAAENSSNVIKENADVIGMVNISQGLTNLTVTENIQHLIERINSNTKAYKKLSYKDAESIKNVSSELNITDSVQVIGMTNG